MASFKEKILGYHDPVCGMQIDPARAKFQSVFEDNVYYFCSQDCKDRFDDDPAKFSNNSNNRED